MEKYYTQEEIKIMNKDFHHVMEFNADKCITQFLATKKTCKQKYPDKSLKEIFELEDNLMDIIKFSCVYEYLTEMFLAILCAEKDEFVKNNNPNTVSSEEVAKYLAKKFFIIDFYDVASFARAASGRADLGLDFDLLSRKGLVGIVNDSLGGISAFLDSLYEADIVNDEDLFGGMIEFTKNTPQVRASLRESIVKAFVDHRLALVCGKSDAGGTYEWNVVADNDEKYEWGVVADMREVTDPYYSSLKDQVISVFSETNVSSLEEFCKRHNIRELADEVMDALVDNMFDLGCREEIVLFLELIGVKIGAAVAKDETTFPEV